MLHDEAEAKAAAISASSLSHASVHSLVRQYLLHYGYADTLAAFDKAAGLSGGDMDDDDNAAAAAAGVGGGSSGGITDDAGHTVMALDGPIAAEGEPQAADAAGELATLPLRHGLRRAIMAGDMQAAVQLLSQHGYPQLLHQQASAAAAGQPGPQGAATASSSAASSSATVSSASGHTPGAVLFDEVGFHINCQCYIELLRAGHVDQAVAFAREVLAGYRGRLSHLEPMLRDVVALVAYQDPCQSPLAHLMSPVQRERVADAVNAAILVIAAPSAQTRLPAATPPSSPISSPLLPAARSPLSPGIGGGGGGHGSSSPGAWSAAIVAARQSALERLLAHLVAVHAWMHELNNGQGAVFRLRDHLLPLSQAQQPAPVAAMLPPLPAAAAPSPMQQG